MIIVFDTETTGLPKKWKAPVSDLENWPRMVQLAYAIHHLDGTLVEAKNFIIKPNGFLIPSRSAEVHGITNEIAHAEGHDLKEVLNIFRSDLENVIHLVAHNISFDEKIVGAEFLRHNIDHSLFEKKMICTKNESTDFCQLPGKFGFKWPTLAELHQILFNEGFEGAHNAANDVAVTSRCFFELVKKEVITL